MTNQQKANATAHINCMNSRLFRAMCLIDGDKEAAIWNLRAAAANKRSLESLAQELGVTYTALVKSVGGDCPV